MLQVLRKGLKEIVVEEVPESIPGPGEVKIRTAYSLISSGTELAGLHPEGVLKKIIREKEKIAHIVERAVRSQGILNTAEAVLDKFSDLSITGYSGAGVVMEKSESVADLEPGQGVAYGGAATGHAEIICAPRNLVAPVPEGVGLKDATLATLGSIALHAVRNASISIGDSVAVIGLGLVGQLVVQLAKSSGGAVFGMDISRERLAQASLYGIETMAASEEPASILGRTGGIGFDQVIVCASSQTSQPIELAVRTVRSRGQIVVVGMVRMAIDWEEAYRKEVRVMVSRAYGPGSYDPLYEQGGIDYPLDYVRWTENRNMGEFLRLVRTGQVRTDRIITHEFPVEEAPLAYRSLAEGAGKMIGAVLRYRQPEGKAEPQRTVQFRKTGTVAAPRRSVLRAGVIGLGNIASWVHLPNIRKHAGLSLQGVCTPKGYRARHLGLRFKSAYCTTDLNEIIRDPEIDVVFICTRNNTHAKIALDALSAGKHVFIEKPSALTREECLRICDAVDRTGLGFMVNYNRRFSPLYGEAQSYFSSMAPKIISVRMNSPDMRGAYWMMDPEVGGGAILGEACHFFDLMDWMAGSEPLTVYAEHLSDARDAQASRNNLSCAVAFKNGSLGSLLYMTVGNRSLGSERVEISSHGHSASIEDMRKLKLWNGLSVRAKKTLWPDKGYYRTLDQFIRGVGTGRSFLEEAMIGARATLCSLAALKSAESHQPERVETV